MKRVPLTVDTIDAFINFAFASSGDDIQYVRQELDAARSQPAIVQGLLDALSRSWRYMDGRHLIEPMTAPDLILWLLTHIGSPTGIDVIHEMVWRPLPPPPTGDGELSVIELFEMSAAEALACISDDRARGLTDEVIRSHPSAAVRDSAYQQRSRPHCLWASALTGR